MPLLPGVPPPNRGSPRWLALSISIPDPWGQGRDAQSPFAQAVEVDHQAASAAAYDAVSVTSMPYLPYLERRRPTATHRGGLATLISSMQDTRGQGRDAQSLFA